MASALHIKDSFVAILINLGNTSRRTTHFDEGSGFQLSLSPEKADVALRPVRRAALKKAPSSTPVAWFLEATMVFGDPSTRPQLWHLQGRVRRRREWGMVVGRMGHNE